MNAVQEQNIIETAMHLSGKVLSGTYLVTGATGTIAEYIIKILMNLDDVKVIAVCHDKRKGFTLFQDYLGDNLIIAQADITEEIPDDFGQVDYVIHAAGICSNIICKEFPQEVINVNVCGTYNVLEYAKRNSIKKTLFFSSASVYGNLSSQIYREEECGEIDFLNTQNVYGLSKRMGETLCAAYKNWFPVVIVRPFHIIAPRIMADNSSMLGEFYEKIISGNTIELNTNSEGVKRNFTWIGDMVSMILELMSCGEGVYNVGNPYGTITVNDMADIMMKITGKNCTLKRKKSDSIKGSNFHDMTPDLGKVSRLIRCDQCMNIEDALEICIKCYD